MREKILEFMKKNKMAEPGDVLCVGFSGGADSVCLSTGSGTLSLTAE